MQHVHGILYSAKGKSCLLWPSAMEYPSPGWTDSALRTTKY
jgi:hypothetical protein